MGKATELSTELPPKALPADEPPKVDNDNRAKASLITEDDTQAEFYFQQGNEAYIRGDFRGAIAAYDLSLHVKPDFHKTWINREITADSSLQGNTPVAFTRPIALQDKSLDQRGYEGQLTGYTIGSNHDLLTEELISRSRMFQVIRSFGCHRCTQQYFPKATKGNHPRP